MGCSSHQVKSIRHHWLAEQSRPCIVSFFNDAYCGTCVSPTLAVMITVSAGENCHATEPGFFRLCWAWVPSEALPEAARRMRAAIDGTAPSF